MLRRTAIQAGSNVDNALNTKQASSTAPNSTGRTSKSAPSTMPDACTPPVPKSHVGRTEIVHHHHHHDKRQGDGGANHAGRRIEAVPADEMNQLFHIHSTVS